MPRTIRTLLFSTLFPSASRPVHGVFVETRLKELLKSGEVEAKVVAPVPWFPSRHPCFGDYARLAETPRHEKRHGVEVFHPRYFLPPKVGMHLAPYTLAMSAIPVVKRIIRDGFDFDLIDAHYFYPDGVAADLIARAVGKPFVVTARGTDINLIPQYSRPRKLIQRAARNARAAIGVCRALVDELAELGVDQAKLKVFRNGVDLERFRPMQRDMALASTGLPADRRILLSVGLLIERKGHDIAIAALPALPRDVLLVIIGAGPERINLEALAKRLDVADRVHFAGQIPNAELRPWYASADALVLCSSREGWANVLLEAMACGTPVIATSIWGTPEVVASRSVGRLMAERTPKALAAAFDDLVVDYPDRDAVRRHAEEFSWQATTEAQVALFREVAGA